MKRRGTLMVFDGDAWLPTKSTVMSAIMSCCLPTIPRRPASTAACVHRDVSVAQGNRVAVNTHRTVLHRAGQVLGGVFWL
jgi:hypothetical protein